MVILTTLFFVCVLVVLVLTVPDQVQMWLDRAKEVIFTEFSWFYVLTFSIFLGFLLILSVSGLGNIRLGRDEDVPEFGFLSWLAMLFAAGMGVGLMFFGVAEPLMHYFSDITVGAPEHRQQQALLHTVFRSIGAFTPGRCTVRLHWLWLISVSATNCRLPCVLVFTPC